MLLPGDLLRGIACRAAAVVVLGLGLAGCFDIEQRPTFQPGGSATIDLSLRFDQSMEDVVALLETYAQYSDDAEKFKAGLCAAAQRFVEAKPVPGKTLQAKQFRSGDRFVCQFTVMLANASDLQVGDPNLPFAIQAQGPRSYRIALNLAAVPDFAKEAQSEIAATLRKEFPLKISEDDLAKLWSKHIAAAVAMTRMAMPNRYVQFTVAGKRVGDSNGTIAPDGTSATFRLTFAELVALALDANARKDRSFYAVVEY
jgi:hypothetical protein